MEDAEKFLDTKQPERKRIKTKNPEAETDYCDGKIQILPSRTRGNPRGVHQKPVIGTHFKT